MSERTLEDAATNFVLFIINLIHAQDAPLCDVNLSEDEIKILFELVDAAGFHPKEIKPGNFWEIGPSVEGNIGGTDPIEFFKHCVYNNADEKDPAATKWLISLFEEFYFWIKVNKKTFDDKDRGERLIGIVTGRIIERIEIRKSS